MNIAFSAEIKKYKIFNGFFILLPACLIYSLSFAQFKGNVSIVNQNEIFFPAVSLVAITLKNNFTDTIERKEIQKAIDQLQLDILKAVKTKTEGEGNVTTKIEWEITISIIDEVDSMQKTIESSTNLNGTEKLTRLKSWQTLLSELLEAFTTGQIVAEKIPTLIHTYQSVIEIVHRGDSLLDILKQSDLTVDKIILKSIPGETTGLNEAKNYVVLKTFEEEPENFFSVLYDFPNVPCADSLLRMAARKLPDDLYTYSQAKNSELGKKVINSKDSLVRLISFISSSMAGRLYFPFLDDLYHKKITFAQINKTFGKDKRIAYYQLLVKTISGYVERMSRKDTAIAMQSALNKLEYNALHDFIYVMNELHEKPDNIRLKVLQTLNPQEMYYLCIIGVNDIYTSTYLKIYKRIFAENFSQNSYLLLQKVHFDHFKRFLKMASTFNTLDNFLNRMKREQANTLLLAFVNGLNETGSIEDAVDVADSYASIRNDTLRMFILKEIENKLSTNNPDSTLRIYNLLYTIFLSLDSSKHIDLTTALGIPSVYRVENNFLKDDSGRIIIQQFFYGDEDGRHAFDVFLKSFRNANWKMINSKYWVEIISVKGDPINIYSNKPLDDDTNQAEKAQELLNNYLKKNKMVPSIFIHRGHSYHLDNTLQYLSAGNKVIFLGSCGGYKQLNKVFSKSPLAQIITTKQEGSGTINQPIINYISELLRTGKNLDWQGVWSVLKMRFKSDTRFDDYVPPYQNLGAILIMALNKLKLTAKY